MNVDTNQDYSKVIKAYLAAFRNVGLPKTKTLIKVAENLYYALFQQYDICVENKDIKQQFRICQLIDEDVLQKLVDSIKFCKDTKDANTLYELHRKMMALSARRNLKNFMLYIERGKSKKVWDKTLDTVRSVFYYADLFAVSQKLNLFRVSLMPSMGKSYIANGFVAQSCGNDPNIQILRITYADDLCQTTTKQTKSIIDSKEFREIFPRYQGVEKIFKTDTVYQFCMCDSDDEYNLFAVTREGQSTGKRAKILLIDDLLKDDSESYNITLHKKMLDRYESTWTSRADDENLKVFLMGTMWADTDLLNIMYDRYCEKEDIVASPKFKYTEVTTTGSAVFIGIPALDEFGKSTCPKRYSTEMLQEKKRNMSEFLWRAVYQQDPIAPEGLEFNDSVLQHYSSLDGLPVGTRYASLDPARKGKNYVSMPITYKINGKHHLVDCLFQKKSMKELYDKIVDKIILHKLNWLMVENNTDTSLKEVLESRLKQKGYFGCTIIEKYSYENKEQRIKDNQGHVRNDIIFPAKSCYSPTSELGRFMESMTSYSFSYPNKFDDAIDSVVLLIMEFISEKEQFPKVGSFSRRGLHM